ncbi:hypothetical protein ABZV91_26870 [Nocardia sp. NPDC004568]|uniref:hypothetical protein n=1 Tax=Nocardia sp. NPDC004568 TaxID=3154551 RepID=UPI0033A8C03D
MDGANTIIKNTGPATVTSGGVAISGALTGNIYMMSDSVAKSDYQFTVEQIVPEQLCDRDAELTEMTEFCLSDDVPRWLWWQAPAWSGKSALLSWFVLNPPPDVRVVSYFITARSSDSNDRTAFAWVVLQQLAEIAAEPVPVFRTETIQESDLIGMFHQAERVCREQNQRLVLVLDGLDEDRGVTVGPDAHSIAATLPARLPGSMRVILAGRPNPPLPDDVLDNHPLRDPAIVRRLARSPYAKMIEADAKRELERLLASDLGRDLLGLVVAAGAGLTVPDLSELTGQDAPEIERQLSTVCGRTFSARPSRWQSSERPPQWLLAHDLLQKRAENRLGQPRIEKYRQQIHRWAADYRHRRWPEHTPMYLLRGYFRLLTAQKDRASILACATDYARHDRLLAVSGGDAAAFDEIAVAWQQVFEQESPELADLLRLAIIRDRLTERNGYPVVALPAAWAALGNLERAEALAHSIPALSGRLAALTNLIKSAADTRDTYRAQRLINQVEATARSISEPSLRARAMADLVVAVLHAGELDRAEAIAESIGEPSERVRAEAEFVRAAIDLGDHDRARRIVRHAEETVDLLDTAEASARATTNLLAAVAENDPDCARWLVEKGREFIATITNIYERVTAAAKLIEAMIAADLGSEVDGVLAEAEFLVSSLPEQQQTSLVWAGLASARAAAGQWDNAVTLAYTIVDPAARLRIFIALATSPAAHPSSERALVEDLTAATDSPDVLLALTAITTIDRQTRRHLLVRAHVAFAHEHGEQTASTLNSREEMIAHSKRYAEKLSELARCAVMAGNADMAHQYIREVEEIAQTLGTGRLQSPRLAALAAAAATAGATETASRLVAELGHAATSLVDPFQQAAALGRLVRAVVAGGDQAAAHRLTGQLGELARGLYDVDAREAAEDEFLIASTTAGDRYDVDIVRQALVSSWRRREALERQRNAAIADDDLDRALSITVLLDSPSPNLDGLHQLQEAAAKNATVAKRIAVELIIVAFSQPEPAAGVAREIALMLCPHIETVSIECRMTAQIAEERNYLDHLELPAAVSATLAEMLAQFGDLNRATQIAAGIRDVRWRATALTKLVQAATLVHKNATAARRFTEQAEALIRSDLDQNWQGPALVALAEVAEQEDARRILGVALNIGEWSSTLDALVRVDPNSVVAAAEMVLSWDHSRH